ncbi:MAG: signal recognition particle protein [Nitrospinaceae bacterium]|nr:signal recognition particle protein [Nitrospinaceae bacterium]NIR53262.1 signal recognition particle protein [Nitrospinaceae bacterium]NIS83660.1 signal recognition particle protein [Nitrospinaceae bacterium]NIT80449.1 signal recognition particle protein [Nitrospinaceae bacterium]NIU42787.1 signal recognition particle protein [Nitrospinaceae bacterium]
MFDNLSNRLEAIYKKLKGRGKLKEADVDEALREIRVALIEADVSLPVIKEFLAEVREKSIGQEVLKSLTPGHQMVKIVNDHLEQLLGGEVSDIQFADKPPTIILMVGLQGSGKTTTVGKLAKKFKKDGKNCLLVPADVYRPAAIEQLNILGRDLEIDVYQAGEDKDPVRICQKAVQQARDEMRGVVIMDTAGRQHIDDALMEEIQAIKKKIEPDEILFVADSMMGQEAVNVAKAFHDAVGIHGVVLTKMDGDARGGAALSISSVTGQPIKFIGTGEKLDALEPFHPDRIASRILGMGDVMTLVDKAQDTFEQEQQEELEKKIKKNSFDLDDFRDQLRQMRKMGSIQDLLGMVPGAGKLMKGVKVDDGAFVRIEAIINSMTPHERAHHNVINGSRKKRIANGSGTSVGEINKLLKQFSQMKKMMKKMSSGKLKGLNLGSLMGGRGGPF